MVVWALRVLASLKKRPMSSSQPRSYNPPMSDDKFRVITEAKVGVLEGTMRSEWDRLTSAQLKLQKMQEEHEQALDAFWNALQRQFGHHADMHNVTSTFRVAENGEVFIEFCPCPVCQAVVHQMTMAATVEEMYKNDLIPPHSIDRLRAKAKMVDNSEEMRKKMLN